MRIINRVAIMAMNKVFSLPAPYRHPHVIRAMVLNPSYPFKQVRNESQGFVTTEGHYVCRQDAADLVTAYKQELTGPLRSVLFSEEVWLTAGSYAEPEGSPQRLLYDSCYNDDKILELLQVEDYTGCGNGYEGDIVIADIFYCEGIEVFYKGYKPHGKDSKTLYSQIFTEQAKNEQEFQARLEYFAKHHMFEPTIFTYKEGYAPAIR